MSLFIVRSQGMDRCILRTSRGPEAITDPHRFTTDSIEPKNCDSVALFTP